jgi:hypothetical protein
MEKAPYHAHEFWVNCPWCVHGDNPPTGWWDLARELYPQTEPTCVQCGCPEADNDECPYCPGFTTVPFGGALREPVSSEGAERRPSTPPGPASPSGADEAEEG